MPLISGATDNRTIILRNLLTVNTLQILRVSQSSLGLKGILKMPGLEPGTSRLSMLSECADHLRYVPVDLSVQALYIGTGPSESSRLTERAHALYIGART